MRIFFDPSTLHQSKSGSITGVVHFELGPQRQFPSLAWNDFVVVLASWWMVALDEIATGKEAKLGFMDGPYWIDVVSQEESVLLRCIEDRRGAGVVAEFSVKSSDLTGAVFGFARQVSDACKKAGIKSVDLDNMRAALPN